MIRRLIEQTGTGVTKKEVERLMAGGEIVKEIRQELTYREIYDSVENMWSLLFMTGYLTKVGEPDGRNLRLAIPNKEIGNIFEYQIMQWFRDTVKQDGASLDGFCESFKKGDAQAIESQFTAYLKKTISIRDTFVRKDLKENFYHGILLGLLGYKASWAVWSNRETGDGYSDILVEISDEDMGIIIEVKYSDNADMEADCRKALHQIEKTNYEDEFRDEGMDTILKYGIACYKKRCKVMLG